MEFASLVVPLLNSPTTILQDIDALILPLLHRITLTVVVNVLDHNPIFHSILPLCLNPYPTIAVDPSPLTVWKFVPCLPMVGASSPFHLWKAQSYFIHFSFKVLQTLLKREEFPVEFSFDSLELVHSFLCHFLYFLFLFAILFIIGLKEIFLSFYFLQLNLNVQYATN